MDFPGALSVLSLASPESVPLLTTIAAAFAAAWVLGMVTQRLGLSPIVGYLLAGVVIGPYTPGYVGDVNLAQQLAELGVILLMFGVGLHFHLKDLWRVKAVALPGALGQSAAATLATVGLFAALGWSVQSGAVLGMALAVASTVVLLRVLLDRGMLNTTHGHVAVGWLIVEDILTVLVLVMVPLLAASAGGTDPVHAEGSAAAADAVAAESGWVTIAWAIGKLAALVAIVLLAGSRVAPWMLAQVSKLRSGELFTLTVLVLSIAIAVGSAVFFGASVALGAFLAGIVVGQSPASHRAASEALPMRDAFAVLFFVSVGMLFDPSFVVTHPLLVLAGLGVVLVCKPLAALVIVAVCGYPIRTALTVAIGLSQIGEFSFILAHAAGEANLLPPEGMHLLVATAMVSITLNPLLFGQMERIERAVAAVPWIQHLLEARYARRVRATNDTVAARIAEQSKPLAVIVGYGPVGRLVDAMLRDAGLQTAVVEMNLDTVEALTKSGTHAIYGDATRRQVLELAGLARAVHLVVTLPHTEGRSAIVRAAREINPTIEVTVRARYMGERDELMKAGATTVVFEEGEAGVALARHVLRGRGLDPTAIERLLTAVRSMWKLDGPASDAGSSRSSSQEVSSTR